MIFKIIVFLFLLYLAYGLYLALKLETYMRNNNKTMSNEVLHRVMLMIAFWPFVYAYDFIMNLRHK
jgi:hypothetical protein